MKPAIAIASFGGVFFLFMGLQAGWFGANRKADADETPLVAKQEEAKSAATKPKETPSAVFPADLAPAARAKPVAAAAEYKSSAQPQKMVFLKVNGALHPWHKTHEEYNDDWHTDRVEDANLVVVVGEQRKSFVDRGFFVTGPPVDRFRWDLDVSVVAAKSGTVLASRSFANMPRPINRMEDTRLVTIGSPIHYRTVFQWLSSQSKAGFPVATNPDPIVTTVGH